MKRILVSEGAFCELNEGFLFYEAQEFGLGDYFTACLRADIEGLKVTAGIHREVQIEPLNQPMETIGPTINHNTGRDDHPRSS